MYPLHADNFHTTAMTSTDADNFHTTAMTSTDADSFPTTYSTEPDVTTTITTISTLTDYSFVSDGVSSASSVVPTVVGVLTFLVAFIGLLVAATIAVLYLYRKRKSKKRRYIISYFCIATRVNTRATQRNSMLPLCCIAL